MSKNNKGMNEEEDPANQFLKTIRILYENKFGHISNEKFAIEIGITKGIFDRYMYRDSPIFDSLKGSASEKIVRNIFDKISAGTNWIDETAFIDILSKYIEDEKNYIQENNLNRAPIGNQILEWINRKYKEEHTFYSTLDFIKDLLYELSIHHNELSILLGRESRYLDDLKQRIRNPKHINFHPNFKFSLENLEILEKNLIEKYAERAHDSLLTIKRYKSMNEDLKEYSGQQYHKFHPYLQAHYFNIIDTKEKAYWLGFLCADGYISGTRIGRLGIKLSIKDKEQIIKFCKTVGLNQQSIREREEIIEYNGKMVAYQIVEIDFWCKPLYDDLKRLKFKEFPKLTSNDLYLAWLLGLYDGDGFQGKTMVCSASYNLLTKIKKKFNIEYEVRDYYFNEELGYHLRYNEENCDNKNGRFFYILTLGSHIFNEMMNNFENSLKRKRRTFRKSQ